LALFRNRDDALDYEAKIYEELSAAKHISNFVTVGALHIEVSSPEKIYKTKHISYEDRKRHDAEGSKP
jgi:hypothetical protein